MVFQLAHCPGAFALNLPRALIIECFDLDSDGVIGALQSRVARTRGQAAPQLSKFRHPTNRPNQLAGCGSRSVPSN